MLYTLKRKKKISNLFIGDRINLMYRFKGVFFIITGVCIFNRDKNIGIFLKKKSYFTFFSILKKNIHLIKNLETGYINKINIKMLYRSY